MSKDRQVGGGGWRRSSQLHLPAGSLATADHAVQLTPEQAGWAYCGLRVVELGPGGSAELETGEEEMAVLPLRGSLEVVLPGERFRLEGRAVVFEATTDWCYVPIRTALRLESAAGCTVALPSARATRRLQPVYRPAESVSVEVRGAGPATRQVNNFMSPQAFAGADKLMCVEVLTPDGNWSSYPPHRHDDSPECPVNNEEIYYFRIGGTSHAGAGGEAPGMAESGVTAGGERTANGAGRAGGSGEGAGFALHRTYTPDGSIDEQVVVHDGDVFVIPRGYHGPTVAAPGYPLYYLNVLAGPGGERSMAFCDDPAHAWVRNAWEHMAPDPRCPMTGAGGPVTPRAR